MNKIIFLFVALLIITGCEVEEYSDCPQDSYPVNLQSRIGTGESILILGDSRGEFGGTWDALPNTVYNGAQGRSTIRGVVNRLYLIDELCPDVVMLFTGANDPAHMDIAEYQSHLSSVIVYCESRGARVYIMNPWISWMARVLLSKERTAATYLFLNVMRSYSEHFVDLSGLDPVYFLDGIHLTDEGYIFLANFISVRYL